MRIGVSWLVLNYQCNNRCVFCYAESTKFATKLEMPIEYAKDVARSMADSGVKSCILIGGEPSLYRYLPEIISFGTSIGLKMRIVTNGRKFASKDFLHGLMDAGLASASISSEASNEELFRKITGVPGAWHETIQGIRNAIALGFPINSLTTVNSLNKDDLTQTAQFLHNLGVSRIMYNFATPNCTTHGTDVRFVLRPDEAARAIEKTYLEMKQRGIRISFLPTLPLCLFSEQVRQELFPKEKMGCACHIYTGAGAVFDPKGQLLPCTHLTEIPTAKVADPDGRFQYRNDFLHFWDDPEAAPARLRKEMWKFPTKQCDGCDYWGRCVGGCPLFRAAFPPHEFIPEK